MTLLLLLACATDPAPPPAEERARFPGFDPPPIAWDGPDTDTGSGRPPTYGGPTLSRDQDGDGYDPAQGDCDDDDPYTHPGAVEYCDTRDQDCDGEPLAPGSCSLLQDPRAMYTTSFASIDGVDNGVRLSHIPVAPGDLDGDGKDDLAIVCNNRCTDELPIDVAWLRGGTVGRDQDIAPLLGGWWTDGLSYATPSTPVGDIDGDGWADWVGFNDNDVHTTYGWLSVHYGPATNWESGHSFESTADAIVYVTSFYYAEVYDSADVDGDGSREVFITTANDDVNYGYPQSLLVLHPADYPSGESNYAVAAKVLDLESVVDEGNSGAYVTTVGDADGDGLDDAVLFHHPSGASSDPWYLSLLSGTNLSGTDAAVLSDVRTGSMETEGWGTTREPAGDLDGDGLADWYVQLDVGDADEEEMSRIYVMTAPTFPETSASPEEAAVGWWDAPVGYQFDTMLSADIDGDDIRELGVRSSERRGANDENGWRFYRGPIDPPAGAEVFSGESYAFWTQNRDSLPIQDEPLVLDYDGDGFPDLLWNYLDEEVGGFAIFPGWAIPWDDPTWW